MATFLRTPGNYRWVVAVEAISPPPGHVVVFHIPLGGSTTSWNTPANPVLAKVGDTLRLVNDDLVMHQLHTNGQPFGHPSMGIAPGQWADYVLLSTFSPPAFLYSHLYGPSIQFFIQVVPA